MGNSKLTRKVDMFRKNLPSFKIFESPIKEIVQGYKLMSWGMRGTREILLLFCLSNGFYRLKDGLKKEKDKDRNDNVSLKCQKSN